MQSARLNDEDWSIISSSSDMDDDQSTASSNDDYHHLNDSAQIHNRNEEKAVSSVATLKLPVISPSDSQVHSDGKILDGVGCSSSDMTSESIRAADEKSVKKIDKTIKFYENLSKLNDSIKERSNKFYQNIAKLRFEQFNNYLQSKDDVNELVEQSTVENEYHLEEDKSDITIPESQTKSSSNNKESLFRCINHLTNSLQQFMELHSEYLIYYFVSFIVGSISLIGIYYYNFIPTSIFALENTNKVANNSFYENLLKYWDDLMYDKPELEYKFFGLYKSTSKNDRSMKVFKIWNQLKTSYLDDLVDNAKRFGTTYLGNFKHFLRELNYEHYVNDVKDLLAKYNYKQLFNNCKSRIANQSSCFINDLNDYIYLTKNSIKGSFNRYHSFLNTNELRRMLYEVKSNVDKTAILVYHRSHPIRKFILELVQ